jgi:hypothetical protein
MRELHSSEKGMQLLPGRPTATARHKAEVGLSIISRTKDSLCIVLSGDANGPAIRHPWTVVPALDDAINP